MKKLFALLFLISLSSYGQLGRAAVDYITEFGKPLDNSLPSPTGENWYFFKIDNKEKGFMAVLMKNKKSVAESYVFENSTVYKDLFDKYMNKVEAGKWIEKKGGRGIFESPTGKLFSTHDFTSISVCETEDVFFSGEMKDFNHYQNQNTIAKKIKYSRSAGRNQNIGLGYSKKSIIEKFGKPFNEFSLLPNSSIYQIKVNGDTWNFNFDNKGECFSVTYYSKVNEFFNKKLLKKFTDNVDSNFDYHGAFGISKSKKYIVSVKPQEVTIYDIFRLRKLNRYKIPSLNFPTANSNIKMNLK